MHSTASVLVFHGNMVLLTYHQKLTAWLYPGGHVEPGETPDLAARREVFEESGLKVNLIDNWSASHPLAGRRPAPFTILVEEIPAAAEPAHQHLDFVYLAVTDRAYDVTGAEAECRWVPDSDLYRLPTPPGFPALVAAGRAALAHMSGTTPTVTAHGQR